MKTKQDAQLINTFTIKKNSLIKVKEECLRDTVIAKVFNSLMNP